MAIDHCAFPDMGEEGEPAVLRLADLPEVHLKVTSYVLEMAQHDEGDPAGIVERLTSAFGANRLCWGSDHPQDQRSTYAGKVELAHHATRTLGAGDRDAVLAGTAMRLWFNGLSQGTTRATTGTGLSITRRPSAWASTVSGPCGVGTVARAHSRSPRAGTTRTEA